MNKYRNESRAAQKQARARKMCLNKKAFPTEAEAHQKGQHSYKCPYCQQWHRSGQLASLVAELKKRPGSL